MLEIFVQATILLNMTALLLKVIAAYLIGSVSGSLLLGAVRHVDIRLLGSGNAGGTNAFRTQGFRFGLGVVIIDIGKAMLAAGVVPRIALPGMAEAVGFDVLQVACGLAAVTGHCFPVWHGFHGGKGAAAAVGALLVIQPLAALPVAAVWVITLLSTGWVGLSTILAGISLVPALISLNASAAKMVFGVAIAVFLLYTHRSNIRRMIEGTEHRFDKARLFRRR